MCAQYSSIFPEEYRNEPPLNDFKQISQVQIHEKRRRTLWVKLKKKIKKNVPDPVTWFPFFEFCLPDISVCFYSPSLPTLMLNAGLDSPAQGALTVQEWLQTLPLDSAKR